MTSSPVPSLTASPTPPPRNPRRTLYLAPISPGGGPPKTPISPYTPKTPSKLRQAISPGSSPALSSASTLAPSTPPSAAAGTATSGAEPDDSDLHLRGFSSTTSKKRKPSPPALSLAAAAPAAYARYHPRGRALPLVQRSLNPQPRRGGRDDGSSRSPRPRRHVYDVRRRKPTATSSSSSSDPVSPGARPKTRGKRGAGADEAAETETAASTEAARAAIAALDGLDLNGAGGLTDEEEDRRGRRRRRDGSEIGAEDDVLGGRRGADDVKRQLAEAESVKGPFERLKGYFVGRS